MRISDSLCAGKYLNMRFVLSGGNWNNSSNAGVWAVNLNNNRTNSNNTNGFRADSILSLKHRRVTLEMREMFSGLRQNRGAPLLSSNVVDRQQGVFI